MNHTDRMNQYLDSQARDNEVFYEASAWTTAFDRSWMAAYNNELDNIASYHGTPRGEMEPHNPEDHCDTCCVFVGPAYEACEEGIA